MECEIVQHLTCLFHGQDPAIFRNQIHGNIWYAAAVCEYASEQLKLSSFACTLMMKQLIYRIEF